MTSERLQKQVSNIFEFLEQLLSRHLFTGKDTKALVFNRDAIETDVSHFAPAVLARAEI